MPRCMFDTNMCIYLMKHQPSSVAQRFKDCYYGDVVMSVISYAELDYGVAMASNPQQARQHLDGIVELIEVLPLTKETVHTYGPLRKISQDRRSAQLDKLIAAHALALDLTLVTNNIRDFVIYPGLSLENWIEDAVG